MAWSTKVWKVDWVHVDIGTVEVGAVEGQPVSHKRLFKIRVGLRNTVTNHSRLAFSHRICLQKQSQFGITERCADVLSDDYIIRPDIPDFYSDFQGLTLTNRDLFG